MWDHWSISLSQHQCIHKVAFFLPFRLLQVCWFKSSTLPKQTVCILWHAHRSLAWCLQINKSFSCCHLMSPCNPDLDSLEWKVWTSCKCYRQDVPTWCLLMLLGWKSAFSLRETVLKACFDSISLSVTTFFLHLKCTQTLSLHSVLGSGLKDTPTCQS